MSNYIKSVAEIILNTPSINTFLINAEKYHAHRIPTKSNIEKKPETLTEHIELVQEKTKMLCEYNDLDVVIDSMIIDFVKQNFKDENNKAASEFIKQIFINTIVFHDYGKINENFQAHEDKMNNSHFKMVDNNLSTHHSALGAFLYIVKHFQEIDDSDVFDDSEMIVLAYTVLAFSYSIFRHHASYLNDEIDHRVILSEKDVEDMKDYIHKYQFEISAEYYEEISFKSKMIFDEKFYIKTSFSFYNLIRLSFSLLTASDYLASGEYMSGMKLEEKDYGLLTRKRIEKIYENVKTNKSYNKKSYSELDDYRFMNPKKANNENLDILRQEMSIELIRNIRANSDKNLFYIEAPTGGGKTNLSMIAAVELLKANEQLKKVFYVFPFTTLITQTYTFIIDTLGLYPHEITQLHSKAGFQTKEGKGNENDEGDADYGNEKKNYIQNLFINYPFCLLTHIRFFDLLKTNVKSENYLLHRLANSVVVLDELQSYNPAHWDKVIYFIRNYAEFYNIKFILMSATLPKLDRIQILKGKVDDFVYLLENAKEDYFRNDNFSKRVAFDFKLLEKGIISHEELTDVILERSKEYALEEYGATKPKDSIYTIVEFIFKKSASEFYKIFNEVNDFFEEIFVLSGTILEHRRKYIIQYLKNPINRKKKVLLITTQVVEAGVDIDMDLGFKNTSLIDSDEQLAGRINRNVNKKNCKLYLFKMDEPSVIYEKDGRYKVTKEKLQLSARKDILENKDFDQLYNLVLEDIAEWNNMPMAIGFNDYEKKIQDLEFKSVHLDFKLIEQENLSIFVPLDIPVLAEGNNEDAFFSEKEMKFLKDWNIHPNTENKISGVLVFDLYLELINNKGGDFVKHQINIKILQGIMAKFIFSVFSNEKIESKFEPFSDADKSEFGYLYLVDWDKLYDEVFGLDESQFDKTENQFL